MRVVAIGPSDGERRHDGPRRLAVDFPNAVPWLSTSPSAPQLDTAANTAGAYSQRTSSLTGMWHGALVSRTSPNADGC